ncbi:GntR family transcriptional regulator [Arthrobacter russicus]|uniref:DNA-binding GntR family transcriptional regulator n=1 Tax=Arthrobacter russicus TaxID=172040 RepID=A0ABU1J942_9MICC|nr:GntR family transcriptional regulator [Arthrobacter russicus]MDN5669694.1 GntR family transcriptional regulator [Renibacterium salmoninarum]MDR6268660.1 DNA-binding GntR family transcriptional regulator [Arthrobacter russicus]
MSTPPQKTPLYRKIADELANRIASGEFIADRSLPSEFELAAQYQVSRGTIRQTFSHLRATGVVTSRQGTRREAVPG